MDAARLREALDLIWHIAPLPTQTETQRLDRIHRIAQNALFHPEKKLEAENAKLREAAVNLMAAIEDMHSRGETFTGRVSIAAAEMARTLKD